MTLSEDKGFIPHHDGSWSVTHIASGLSVLPRIHSESDARAGMRALADRIDWTVSPQDLDKDAVHAKIEISNRFDTHQLREQRMNVAKDLGMIDASGSLSVDALSFSQFEIRVLHALIRFRNAASEIAESMPASVAEQYGTRLTSQILRILQDLERRGFTTREAGRPVKWFLRLGRSQSI